jgi:hypothetical protein
MDAHHQGDLAGFRDLSPHRGGDDVGLLFDLAFDLVHVQFGPAAIGRKRTDAEEVLRLADRNNVMDLIGEAIAQGRIEEQGLDVVGVSGRRLGEGNGVFRHGGELLQMWR